MPSILGISAPSASCHTYAMHKKLNLGCGTDIREGWVNLDSAALPGVDVVHDINSLPLPFAADSFDEIVCQDILEHIADYTPLLKELHRVLAPGGMLRVRVPHFTSKNNFSDPTHRRMFSSATFDFFTKGTRWHKARHYYFDFSFSSITELELTFEQDGNDVRVGSKYERRPSGFRFGAWPPVTVDITVEVPAAFAADVDRRARFEREARVLASLDHPNIATIHGFEGGDGLHALVMELVDGEVRRRRG